MHLDTFLRTLLSVPAALLERLDGGGLDRSSDDPERVFPLVQATRRTPEAYLALEPGLHYFEDDTGLVAWQRRGRTAFAVGGLNVPDDAQTALLTAWAQSTEKQGVRRHLFFPLRDAELERAAAAGFRAIQVGVEPWIALPALDWRGKRWAQVRQMRNRATRNRVIVEEVPAADYADAMRALHHRWLASKKPNWRMKLLIGSPALDHPFDRRYFAATRDGELVAFATVLPGETGTWGLDVMCRDPRAPAGAMELLIVAIANTLRDEGARWLTLGACPMAGIPAPSGLAPLSRIFRFLFSSRMGNELFRFHSLYQFKAKFSPEWRPVYFGASPKLGALALYRGCRMWGLY